MPKVKKQEEKKETKEQPQQTTTQQTTTQQQPQDEDLQTLLTNIYAKLTQLDEKVDRLRKSLYWHRRLSEYSKRKGYYKRNYKRGNRE